jgi:hypothetical protein
MVLLLISLVLLAPVILGVIFSAVFAAPLLGIGAAAAIPNNNPDGPGSVLGNILSRLHESFASLQGLFSPKES